MSRPRQGVRQTLLVGALVALACAVAPASAQTARQGDPARGATADEPAPAARSSPRYLLQGSHGRAVTSEDFQGRFQLIAFGYTSCPDVCPTTLLEMKQVLAALGPRARHLQPIFISVDPQRDSLVVLDAYTRAFDERILGLTGSAALIRHAADAFKVVFEKVQEPGAGANVYTVDHSTGLFLLGPDGQLLGRIGYGSSVADIVARIDRWLAADGR